MRVHFLKHVLLGLAIAAGFGAIVMWLWNWLIPATIGWKTLHFWQALGMLALARILFGGFGGFGGHWMHGHSHSHLYEKWRKMTPEERETFIRKRRQLAFGARDFHGRRGFGPEESSTPDKGDE
ncbi:MAG: hypothetical protein LBP98_05680 [Tannerella sp.]|nr:hypothetical protein [Tannerella sp.]